MRADSCAPGVNRLMTGMANLYFVADEAGGWTLVDAGLPGFAWLTRQRAAALFGRTPPSSIVLTHGHFDHVGTLPKLAVEWGVPIYAHPLEMPYLTGRSAYPPPDPTVGGGLQSWLSSAFPRGPIDLGDRVRMLPADGSIPTLPGWRWIHTPGHTAGHVSLFRDADRTLIAGDAFVTTRQESLSNVVMQRQIVWRPPAYYTQDWLAARHSVEALAALEPEVAATGHGVPMHGAALRAGLGDLAERFEELRPHRGRYVHQPARADERGVLSVPPPVGPNPAAVALGVAAIAIGVAVARARRSRAWR